MNIAKKNKKTGFLLIEVIVGISILAFCLLGIISVGQGFLRLSFQSFQNSQANFLSEEGIEVTRAIRDTSWTDISALTNDTRYYISWSGGKWATSTAQSLPIDRIFYRYFTVSAVNRDAVTADIVTSGGVLDTGTKKVTVVVAWRTSVATSTKTTMAYLTNL